jgi:hypothetical protein
MYLPKWIIAILFASSFLSTASLTYVLAFAKNNNTDVSEKNVIVVSSPAMEEVSPKPTMAEENTLLASTKWETHKESRLEMQTDYPSEWTVFYDEAENTLSISDPKSVNKSISYSRRRKAGTGEKLEDVVKMRKETLGKQSIAVNQDAQSPKLDGYDTNVITYEENKIKQKQIYLATRNYIYTITVAPENDEFKNIFNEILNSFKII